MKPTDEIEKYVKDTKIKTDPVVNKAVFDDLLKQLETAEGFNEKILQPSLWRTIMKNRMTQFTSAAAILIVSAIIFSLSVSPSVTFADIIKPFMEAETFAFDLFIGGEGGPSMHERVKGNRYRRTVSNMPNIALIIDADAGQLLRLDTAGKTASLVDIAGPIKKHAQDYIALVRDSIQRQMADANVEPEEDSELQIDGRKTIEYSIGDASERVTIVADAKTGQLLQIEMESGHILKNFEFDIEISDQEVSLDPPAGYTMQQTQMDFSNLSEKDLVEGLRVWAKYLGEGTFPSELSKRAYMENIPLLRQSLKNQSVPLAEADKYGKYYMQSMFFLQTIHFGPSDWKYVGADVKLGDAETAVFWYQPEGSDNYRVIYGDLSVKDVAPADLPK